MHAFLRLAIKQAERSPCRFRVAAVLVRGSRVLTHATNIQRNSPTTDFRHATFHAEEVLLRRTRRAHGSVVYVARVGKNGAPMMARPCPRCQKVLVSCGITVAHYTTEDGPRTLHMA
ncbi:hypothetical protein I5Q34_32905 [Streptomyces sp. AV19]|uniref:hypothetical protein n=1 Tax=Streptomyces sp. AV19 TaxID=2793068 RepID=UPI0018FE6E72|nr:hypothetical protein [Streptomyces sp. AV19]